VVGVGASGFARDPDASVLQLAGAALRNALADADLEARSIDGLVVQIGSPRGADYDSLAEAFGLDVRFSSQSWAHGRFTATCIAHAALAVATGLATRVACVLAMKNSGFGRLGEASNPFFYEQFRENGGPHGEDGSIGLSSPVAGAAMAFDLYCRRYGKNRALLAAAPLTFRRHAQLTDDAVAREPLTLEAYQNARMIVEPLRLYDCSPVGDGAVCLIVAGKAQVPRDRPAAWITGVQGLPAGRDTYIFGPRGLGVGQQGLERPTRQQAAAQPVFAMAGLTPETVDTLGVYDSFSPLVPFTLEAFGFCEPGEGLDFIQDDRIALGGALPTNTSGGQLSQAQLNGWAQIRELVLQLRGLAGPRQVPSARRALWAATVGDALALERR
jgi:acetyl-CoA acetyltransferase